MKQRFYKMWTRALHIFKSNGYRKPIMSIQELRHHGFRGSLLKESPREHVSYNGRGIGIKDRYDLHFPNTWKLGGVLWLNLGLPWNETGGAVFSMVIHPCSLLLWWLNGQDSKNLKDVETQSERILSPCWHACGSHMNKK